jgi:hypothetical protein
MSSCGSLSRTQRGPNRHWSFITGLIVIAIFSFVSSLPKPGDRVMKAIRKDQKGMRHISPPSAMQFRSYSYGQGLAAPIKLATGTLPSENSQPQYLTNAMNTLDAEHRFRQI